MAAPPPAAPKPTTIFQGALGRARVIRQGDIVHVIVDGAGAMVIPTLEFAAVQRWAMGKPGSGNPITDRGRFFDKITVLVSRPGSVAATRGHEKQLETLARHMNSAGFDLAEWNLPPEIKDPKLKAAREALEEKRREQREAEKAAGQDGDPDKPT